MGRCRLDATHISLLKETLVEIKEAMGINADSSDFPRGMKHPQTQTV